MAENENLQLKNQNNQLTNQLLQENNDLRRRNSELILSERIEQAEKKKKIFGKTKSSNLKQQVSEEIRAKNLANTQIETLNLKFKQFKNQERAELETKRDRISKGATTTDARDKQAKKACG